MSIVRQQVQVEPIHAPSFICTAVPYLKKKEKKRLICLQYMLWHHRQTHEYFCPLDCQRQMGFFPIPVYFILKERVGVFFSTKVHIYALTEV